MDDASLYRLMSRLVEGPFPQRWYYAESDTGVLGQHIEHGRCWFLMGQNGRVGSCRQKWGPANGRRLDLHIALWNHLFGAHPDHWISGVAGTKHLLVLDHLCAEGRCCNPGHLELVSMVENLRRRHSGTPYYPSVG